MTNGAGSNDAPNEGRAVHRQQYLWFPTFGTGAPVAPVVRTNQVQWSEWRDDVEGRLSSLPHAAYAIGNWHWEVPWPSDVPACGASSISGAIEISLRRPTRPFNASVPFIYYYGRYLNGAEQLFEGISIYNGLKACYYAGICPNDAWPLSTSLREDNTPPLGLSTRARTDYGGVSRFRHLDRQAYGPLFLKVCKQAITQGYAIIFVASVDDAFRTRSPYLPNDELVWVPRVAPPNDHSLLAVGYEDTGPEDRDGFFRVRDSFGPNRGLGGYLRLPYEYVIREGLTRSFWLIEEVITRGQYGEGRDPRAAQEYDDNWMAHSKAALEFARDTYAAYQDRSIR
jgi:hypothetical protein